MKKTSLNYLTGAVIASLLFIFASQVSALTTTPHSNQNNQGLVRSCQARESAVKTRMSQMVALASNMQSKFDSIALKVENFYTSKVLPQGKTLPNYDALVANIQTQKNLVSAALNQAQTDMNGFSCSNGNPKALLNQFRIDMQKVKSALKNYRITIKNLITGVHSISWRTNPGSPVPTQ